MTHLTTERAETSGSSGGDATGSDPARRPRRRVGRIVLGVAAGLVLVLVGAGALVWFGRGEARERRDDEAIEDFRSSGGAAVDATGRPDAGVYGATADGSESVGIPGLDEALGPNAPVTVTHGEAGCFTHRVDLNTHHWRSWTFCPTGSATFALAALQSFSTRDVPGIDVSSLLTYTCDEPVPYLWPDQAVGDRREGRCTGTSDSMDGVTTDAGSVEVLEVGSVRIAGTDVPAVHVRSTDVLGGAQTGREVDEWWLDASTGLPLRIVIDGRSTSESAIGSIDYSATATVELTSLTPAT